jgi:hypothetical protein
MLGFDNIPHNWAPKSTEKENEARTWAVDTDTPICEWDGGCSNGWGHAIGCHMKSNDVCIGIVDFGESEELSGMRGSIKWEDNDIKTVRTNHDFPVDPHSLQPKPSSLSLISINNNQ